MNARFLEALEKASADLDSCTECAIEQLLRDGAGALGVRGAQYTRVKAGANPFEVHIGPHGGPIFGSNMVQATIELCLRASEPIVGPGYVAVLVGPRDAPIGIALFRTRRLFSSSKIDCLRILVAAISRFERMQWKRDALSRLNLELKVSRDEFKRQANFMAATLESLHDGVVISDINGKVIARNAAAIAILPTPTRPHHLGKIGSGLEFFEIDEKTPVPVDQIPLARTLKGEAMVRQSYFVRGADAEGVPIAISSSPVRDQAGKLIGGVVTFFDLTPIQLAKKQLEEHQQMLIHASRMSAVGELVGAIAHEINTPLATLSLLLEDTTEKSRDGGAPLNPVVQDNLEMMDRLVQKVSRIVQSIRALCRAKNDEPFTSVPIARLLTDVEELCVYRLAKAGISLTIKRNHEVETAIDCRPVQIVQVLLNLINNACDALRELDSRWIEIEVIHQGDVVQFLVTDSGPGIPDNVAEMLFKPFFSTKASGFGCGIGLNISKRIVEAHQGSIELVRGNQHTRFSVTLPIIQRLISLHSA